MTKRVKTLQQGPGKSWTAVNSVPKTFAFETSMLFRFQDRPASQGGGYYIDQSLPLYYNGIKVCDIPCPDTVIVYGRPSPFVSDGYSARVASAVKAGVDPQRFAVQLAQGVAAIVGIDSKTTTQESSESFREKQGKEAVVNSFFSVTDKATFGTASASASGEVTASASGQTINWSGASVLIRVSIPLPFVGGVTEPVYNRLMSCLDNAFPLTSTAASLHASAVYDLQQGDMDLLTSIAEMEKTVSYVVGRLSSIARIISMVRRKDFSFLKNAKVSADPYLEARYAVRPLIIDAENAIKAFNNTGALSVLLRKSRRERIDDIQNVEFSLTDSNSITYNFTGVLAIQGFRSGGAIGKLSADLPSLYSLGMFNVATTAVEIIPWSFVFQWFVNISGLIASLNPNPVYELQAGWLSVKGDAVLTGTLRATRGADTVTIPISWSRSQYTRLPKRDPSKFVVDVNLTIPKIADLMAFVMK